MLRLQRKACDIVRPAFVTPLLLAAALTVLPAAVGAEPPPDEHQKPDAPANEHDRAVQELKTQKKQRILGIIPNFNTSNVQNAARLSGGQKFRLALRGAVDPFAFLAAGIDAGLEQSRNGFPGYGQGVEGYARRMGAAYTDSFSGTMLAGAVFPTLLHQDPRYFRKGEGTFSRRLLYAVSTTVKAKNDYGRWMPNYSNILGNLAAGGLANLYYPSADRGARLTLERAFTVTAEGAIGSIFVEFWPDISSHLFHKH